MVALKLTYQIQICLEQFLKTPLSQQSNYQWHIHFMCVKGCQIQLRLNLRKHTNIFLHRTD